jgi:hypothetical protein
MQGVWEQNWGLETGQALDGFEILLLTNGRDLRAIAVHDYYCCDSEVLRLFALGHHMFTTALHGSLDASACLPVPTYSAVLITLAAFAETGTEQHQEIQCAAVSPAVGPCSIPLCLADV